MNDSVITEILKAMGALKLNEASCRVLTSQEAYVVRQNIQSRFVNDLKRRWWWEDFKFKGHSKKFEDGKGFRRICDLVPNPDERLWLICEDDALPEFPIFETTARVAQSIIGEAFAFEYYLVSKNYSWLLCENHHNRIIALGSEVEDKIRSF